MTGDHPEIEEADLLLARSARNDFAFAEHIQRRGLATDDAAELGELARASARLTRSMRQSLALLSKQKSDREKAERERRDHEARQAALGPPAPNPADLRRERHMDDIQTGVSRVIVAAAGGDRGRIREHLERFDREMDDWTEQPDFEDHEADDIIRHAGRVLGLPPHLADRWRDLPEPESLPDPAPQPPASRRDPKRPLNWPPSRGAFEAEHPAPPTAAADSS